MINQNNPCESCIHQSKSWNDEPCYRCGSENNYAWCEDEQGNFLMLSSLKEQFTQVQIRVEVSLDHQAVRS